MTASDKKVVELTTSEIEALLKERKEKEQKEINKRKKDALLEKEIFLNDAADKFKEARDILSTLKEEVIRKAEQYNALKYELDGKPVKETKSFELKNDKIKVIVESQEKFEFNDEAIVHITAIKEIFKEKFENRNKGMYALLDGILMRNSKGDYDAKLLTKARSQVKQIGDQNLINEFDKLQDCLVVVGTSKYTRLYVKDDKNKWKDISLNFSSL